uniref:hypothetical protein n=1 Tax=Pararhizobium sp. IMCC3301 TaxID=3067904 RepID=UPI002742733E|nr:hypothetical protein [Pararhizobium sp. IMCC3301]
MGGTDKDVKEYFFNLDGKTLDTILQEYGKQYGEIKEEYARQTFSDWKAGARRMSGLVAKRLFDLLPPRMPLSKKYELAENVWVHFGPTSKYDVTIGPTADVNSVAGLVSKRLDDSVSHYEVPDNVKRRFAWLTSGDVKVQTDMLNHFRQLSKELAASKVLAEIPVLQRQVLDHADTTGIAKSVLQVHKHEISIWIDPDINDVIQEDTRPNQPRFDRSTSEYSWVWWLVGLGILLWVLLK